MPSESAIAEEPSTSSQKVADFSTGWVKEIDDLRYKPESIENDSESSTTTAKNSDDSEDIKPKSGYSGGYDALLPTGIKMEETFAEQASKEDWLIASIRDKN